MGAPYDSWNCFECRTVAVRLDAEAAKQCSSCGSTRGELLSADRVTKGVEAGVYWNIDLRTGGPAKKRRR